MRTALLLLPTVLGGAVCAAWAWPFERLNLTQGLAWLLWLVASAAAVFEWRRPATGILRWDGERWNWDAASGQETGTVQPRLDWQGGLLLEFTNAAGRRRWLWPRRSAAPLYWDALRRALYAPAAGAGPRSPAGGGL